LTAAQAMITQHLQQARQMRQQPVPAYYRQSTFLKKRLNNPFPGWLNLTALLKDQDFHWLCHRDYKTRVRFRAHS